MRERIRNERQGTAGRAEKKEPVGTSDNFKQSETLFPGCSTELLDEFGQACLDAKPMAMRAIRTVAPRLEAEDVYQSACLQAFRNRGKFRGEAKFSTWFVTIALNCARSQCRNYFQRSRTPDLFCTVDDILDVRSEQETPEDRVLRKERDNLIFAAITKLSELSRRAVLARYYRDLRIKDMARLLGASDSATKARLFNARLALCSLLRQTF